MNLSIGSCSTRSKKCELIESPSTSDDDLSEVFDVYDVLARIAGEYRLIQGFFKDCSAQWRKDVPISVLDLRCGRGDASRHIIRWARKEGWDLRILAVDSFGRIVQMARERQAAYPEIVFDVRDMSDQRFLQAQQFDYVISSMALHHESDARTVTFLKTVNRLARRGFLVTDWFRDIRAYLALRWMTSFFKSQALSHDIPLGIQKGFTFGELKKLSKDAGIEYAARRIHFGYRFSLSGERGLALVRELQPIRPLAGA